MCASALQALRYLLRHDLAERNARAQAHRITDDAAALARAFGELRQRLRGLVLHELAHVAPDHSHADALVQDLLQLFGQ